MNAPPFPIAPEVGQWFQNWVWNGARWVASPTTGLRVMTQVFSQSGPYMPSPGLVSCLVECVGGGGAGGFVVNENGQWGAGGGGGSGAYSRSHVPAALVRGGVLVTIGAGASGAVDPNYNKVDVWGGTTSFGALVTAPGGGNAWPLFASHGSFGGHGWRAPAGSGDLVFVGHPGDTWVTCRHPTEDRPYGVAGIGGAIISGQSGPNSQFDSEDGNSANGGSGAGGTGAQSNYEAAGTQRPGGDGGAGFCVVTEYCWGDRDQPDVGWRPPLDVNVTVRPPKPPWPPRPPGPWWPPGWPPGWGPGQPWPPGWGPWPGGRQAIEGQEFEAGAEPYSLPETEQDPEDR